jgi:hypothetical protein
MYATMSNLFLFLSLLFASLVASAASSSSSSVAIQAWPLSASKPAPLASITYWPEHLNATLNSWTPPTIGAEGASNLVRIGLRDSATGRWTGIATAAEGLSPDLFKTLSLHIDAAGNVFGVGFSAAPTAPVASESSTKGKSKSSKNDKEKSDERADITIEVLRPADAKPALNKPVVLRADGKVEGKEEGEQKTFLQK